MEHEGPDSKNTVSPTPNDGQSDTPSGSDSSSPEWRRREPTVLTIQDLIDLPRQILPEETYIHLRNAFREASLAAFSLWRSVDKARKGSKVRTHIDVE